MPEPDAKRLLSAAREALARPLDFSEFLAKLAPKDRASAEKRVATLEAGPDPARAHVWRRMACTLMKLAPHAAKLVGQQTVQFYVADGKYRMQVFALEDLQDGQVTVYCPDVAETAQRVGLLGKSTRVPGQPDETDARVYAVGPGKEPLRLETLDKNSANPAAHFKDMVGWNRRALRVTLPPSASPAAVEVVEMMCAIAAQRFAPAAPATPK
jgi:hypothetical protein